MYSAYIHRVVLYEFDGYVLGDAEYGLNFYKNSVILNNKKISFVIEFDERDTNTSIHTKICRIKSKILQEFNHTEAELGRKRIGMLTTRDLENYLKSLNIDTSKLDLKFLTAYIQKGPVMDLGCLLGLVGAASLKGKELDQFAKAENLPKRKWFERDKSYGNRIKQLYLERLKNADRQWFDM